ncbi:rhodanese-like domain-containing protein [candidate division KSB1 bacterium]|nr:rhodanese-like domain-containing protein [candidate division KSB1 bacterium]
MSKKLLLLLLCLGLSLSLFINCDKDNPAEPEPEPINEFNLVAAVGDQYFTDYTTASGGVNVSITDLFPILSDTDTSNDPYIIDYRSAPDYATGHIKGAVNIGLKSLLDKVEDGTIPANKRIVNVCYTGQTASHATALLNMLGYDAQNLLYGMCGVTTDSTINGTQFWSGQIAEDEFGSKLEANKETLSKEYAFPTLSTGKQTAEEVIKARFATYMENYASWAMISAADVFANPSGFFIVNYWAEADYVAPGHIKGAYQFTPNVSLQKAEKLKYLPTDKKIVVYCWTGQTSAQVVAYLQILGYEAYSLTYGVNGFAYKSLSSHKFVAPVNDYSSIIVK